jgi:hypothetical protein
MKSKQTMITITTNDVFFLSNGSIIISGTVFGYGGLIKKAKARLLLDGTEVQELIIEGEMLKPSSTSPGIRSVITNSRFKYTKEILGEFARTGRLQIIIE